jgi:hypothetical protein
MHSWYEPRHLAHEEQVSLDELSPSPALAMAGREVIWLVELPSSLKRGTLDMSGNIVHSGRLGGVILVAQRRTEPFLCLSGSAGDLYLPGGSGSTTGRTAMPTVALVNRTAKDGKQGQHCFTDTPCSL